MSGDFFLAGELKIMGLIIFLQLEITTTGLTGVGASVIEIQGGDGGKPLFQTKCYNSC